MFFIESMATRQGAGEETLVSRILDLESRCELGQGRKSGRSCSMSA
jgi:hypothetical protein